MKKSFLAFAMFVLCFITANALTVSNLKTQGMANPIGVDITTPSFSWIIESDQRGVMQQTYSIRVATDADFANVVWESGQVESDQSVDVDATGFTAEARTRYYWQVTVTDNKGNVATSAEKAYFETGLMSTVAWGPTKWIKATTNAKGAEVVENPENYEVSVDFDIRTVSAGIIFAASNHSNYYMWQVNLEQATPRFRPHVWSGGNPSCIAENNINNVSIRTGETHNMRIEVTGAKTAKTYIDNVLIDTRSGNFAYGEFGFREDYAAIGDESAYFDNFVVTSNGQTLLSEDFEHSNVMFSSGRVENGRFLVIGRGTYAWQQNVSAPVRYDIDVDMTLIKDDASICFAATADNTYMMWAINTYKMSKPVVRRHVYNHSSDPVYSDVTIPFSKEDLINTKRHIRLECETPYVRTYIDDQLVDTFEDNSGVLAMGDIGFRVYGSNNGTEDERAYFDNLVLTVYDENEEGKVALSEDFEGSSNIFSTDAVYEYDGSRQLYMASSGGQANRLMQNEGSCLPGAPMVRKAFTLKSGIKKARLYSTGLGVYNVYINGTRVGMCDEEGNVEYDELKPGSTDFKKTVFYTTHDVTRLLQAGDNAIGAEMTNGWWKGGIAHGEFGDGALGFRGMIIVTYEDGSEETIGTDLTWSSNTNGALRKGDIYDGETYDARLESDWSKASFNDGDWYAVAENKDFKGDIFAYEGPAIKAVPALARYPQEIFVYEGKTATGTTHGALNEIQDIKGNQSITLKAGQTAIYDYVQNAAGWVNFTVKGQRGTKLRFRFSEMRNTTGDASRGDDGPANSLYLINLRSAQASLYYTLKGDPEGETFHPTTTYYGFRYVEVTASSDVEIVEMVGETVTSAMTEKSSLTTSHEDVNKLFSNCLWGQRSNLFSVPTDCPQRDERLGWTGDTQVYANTGMYNADARTFYAKWMRDMRDSQRSDGAFPHVAPFSWNVGYGAAAWADAGVIVPWKVYLMTGDKKIIEDNWTAMEKYMTWLASQREDGYNFIGPDAFYGDWVAFVETDKRYISYCYYAYVSQLMEKMAYALAKSDTDKYARKAKTYHTRYENIRKEWQGRYLNTSGTPKYNTQCAYLMALRYNMLSTDEQIEKTKQALARNISNNGDKLNTGFLGTAILNHTLTQYGMNDEAYTLLLQRDCPSWLYSVDQGATTIWERWNSYTIATGFGDPGMNSFNHYSYGAIAEWMYRYMAGVSPDEENVGFKHIILQPAPDTRATLKHGQERITSVAADVWTPYGSAKGAWTCDGGVEMTYKVTVPANTTATLYMPVAEGMDVFEGAVPAAEAEGVEYVGTENGKAVYTLGSGSYEFSVGEPSGIIGVNDDTVKTGKTYTINGIQVKDTNSLLHGIFITDGKKVVR